MEWSMKSGLVFSHRTDHPEETVFMHITLSMLNKVLCNYVVPLLRRITRKDTLLEKNLEVINVTKNLRSKYRTYIASHLKSVYENVNIFVLNSPELCNVILRTRLEQSVHFIGLDCEWNSEKKNNVAVIQVSAGNECFVYSLHQAEGCMPIVMKELLEDKKILKFGVAIKEDANRLRNHGVHVKGFVDLRNLAQRCLPLHNSFEWKDDSDNWPRFGSLRSLAIDMLDVKLNKNYHIRCGNWESSNLSRSQILYAAKDAIVSLEVFYALVLLRKVNRQSLTVLPSSFDISEMSIANLLTSEYSAILKSNIYTYSHKTDLLYDQEKLDCENAVFEQANPSSWLVELAYSLCQGIIDCDHKYRPPKPKNMAVNIQASRAYSTMNSTKLDKHQCRSKPLYENCFLLGPDKKILATVNRSKADWYVKKSLGSVESDEPYTVRLHFEPSGRPMPDADYYTTCKSNVCVVCGSGESHVRKMIIPHDYRKYFPMELKDHMSHDVLLMCINCHRIAQQNDEMVRQQLADQYNAPLATKERMLYIVNPQLGSVKSAAKALLHGGEKIPEKRRIELENIVKGYFKVEEITQEILKQAIDMDVKIQNKEFRGTHGERVVRSVVENGTLLEFVKMWRQNFLDFMQPKFLPPMWSVEHNLQRVAESQKNLLL